MVLGVWVQDPLPRTRLVRATVSPGLRVAGTPSALSSLFLRGFSLLFCVLGPCSLFLVLCRSHIAFFVLVFRSCSPHFRPAVGSKLMGVAHSHAETGRQRKVWNELPYLHTCAGPNPGPRQARQGSLGPWPGPRLVEARPGLGRGPGGQYPDPACSSSRSAVIFLSGTERTWVFTCVPESSGKRKTHVSQLPQCQANNPQGWLCLV